MQSLTRGSRAGLAVRGGDSNARVLSPAGTNPEPPNEDKYVDLSEPLVDRSIRLVERTTPQLRCTARTALLLPLTRDYCVTTSTFREQCIHMTDICVFISAITCNEVIPSYVLLPDSRPRRSSVFSIPLNNSCIAGENSLATSSRNIIYSTVTCE